MESKNNKKSELRSFDVYDVKRCLNVILNEIDENILPFEKIGCLSITITRKRKIDAVIRYKIV